MRNIPRRSDVCVAVLVAGMLSAVACSEGTNPVGTSPGPSVGAAASATLNAKQSSEVPFNGTFDGTYSITAEQCDDAGASANQCGTWSGPSSSRPTSRGWLGSVRSRLTTACSTPLG